MHARENSPCRTERVYTCFEGASSFPLGEGYTRVTLLALLTPRLHHSPLLPLHSLSSFPSRSCSRSPLLSFPRSFFREPSSPSAFEESSRPSHVRGNPANFVEFPRNELKETGAGGRERWTRFERIVTYEAREDDDVNTYRVSLIARERAKIHSASRTLQTLDVLTAPPIFRDNI